MAPAKLIPLLTILMCLGIGFASFAIYTGLKNQPVVQDVATPFPSETPQETFLVFDFPTSSESSTPTVTPSPRPTPTQIDYGDMPITQTATTLLVIANTAQAGIVQVNQTQSALDDAKTREAAANSAISTAYAMAAATDDERVRVDHANAEYNLSLQKARDNLSLTFDYIWKIGGSILLILAIALGMLWVYYRAQLYAHRKAVETISDNLLDNIHPPIINHVKSSESDGYGTTRRIPDLPDGDESKIRAWACEVIRGHSIAVDKWEGKGTPFTKSREYRHGLYAWAIRYSLDKVNKSGERVLNDDGVQIVSHWLLLHPLPISDNMEVSTDSLTVNTDTVGTV